MYETSRGKGESLVLKSDVKELNCIVSFMPQAHSNIVQMSITNIYYFFCNLKSRVWFWGSLCYIKN